MFMVYRFTPDPDNPKHQLKAITALQGDTLAEVEANVVAAMNAVLREAVDAPGELVVAHEDVGGLSELWKFVIGVDLTIDVEPLGP